MISGNVGYKRVIVIAVLSTAFAIVLDYYGVINRVAAMIPGKG